MTREDATRKREARRGKVRMLRRTVAGGAVTLFLVVWSLIAIVLITGHDPALARKAAALNQAASSTATGSTASTTPSAVSTGAS